MAEFHAGDQRLSYEISGDGDPVVMLSNLAVQEQFWPAPFVGRLAGAGHTVVTLQHHGPSGELDRIVADMAASIEHLGLAPVHLWGYSQGAMFAQELALARPDLVRSATLMATVGRKTAYMRFLLEGFYRSFQAIREREPAAAQAADTMMLLLNFPPSTLANDAFVEMMIQMAASAGPMFAGDAMERSEKVTTAYEDRLEALRGIKAPCLVLAFENDMNALAAGCREVADAIPEARYVEIAGAAHSGIATHTDDVFTHVLTFLADT